MKTLISLLTLAAIAFVYILSTSLYLQGNLLTAYLLMFASLTSLTFWIRSHDLLRLNRRA
jgi:hypothetical protein